MSSVQLQPKTRRRLRLGMVGGGPGAFIGAVHRIAARLDDRYELVAAALTSDAARNRAAADELHIPRSYGNFQEMADAEKAREDRIDAVAIVTPNHLHFAPAKAFLEAGIHVICDKPLTTTLEDAQKLAEIVKRSGLIFGLTHNYTGYPMIRQAREMVRDGALGSLRVIQVEYAQDWLTTKVEATGQKQAEWRTDPARSGPAGSLGDIGTHAFNIAAFVSGLACTEVAADLTAFVPGRRLDDNVQLLLRYEKNVRGMLWASQVAPGNDNHLGLRIYGDKAGIAWNQERANELLFTPYGEPPRTIARNGAGSLPVAAHASRLPSGHPEGYLEGFAQLYTDLAEQIHARLENREPDAAAMLVPGIQDGVDGLRFITAVIASSKNNSAWTALP
ncbi:MAG TPA: Gfo/Idh/MocA family oxidoreductase [Candidatus Dormibacteraeota bacterium]|nr:Gfo/Idh/MocA family oxidoreductase [Candidatus Dormibacteraeota bacterium]